MSYEEYEGFFCDIDNGRERCREIKRAINEASEKQDVQAVLYLYYVFTEEDTFYSDGFESFLIFPEYLRYFEAHPEFTEEFKYNVMWCFKWIAGSAEEFWQISLSQLYDLYKQYGEYCDKLNYNKRSYYRKLWNLMDVFGLRTCPFCANVEQAHRLMMHCPVDDLSEIEAGEADDLTSYYLSVEKDIDMAYKAAEKIFSGVIYTVTVRTDLTIIIFTEEHIIFF